MAKNISPQRRKDRRVAQKPLPFRALMTKEQNSVHERLQLFGDFPECTPQHCCQLDWLHVLMIAVADAAEYARLDECDPQILKALKRQLAITAAACEMWADSLEES